MTSSSSPEGIKRTLLEGDLMKLYKKIVPLIVILLICFCGISTAELAQTSNAIVKKINDKSSKCGYMIDAEADVPWDTMHEQVKPTLLDMFGAIHTKYPACDWIDVAVYTSGGSKNGYQVGYANYRDKNLEITVTIPSQDQIKELQQSADEDEETEYVPPRMPTKDEYELGSKFYGRFYKLDNMLANQDNKAATKNGKLDIEKYYQLSDTRFDRVYKIIANELNEDPTEIRRIDQVCKRYFGMPCHSETIKIK